MNIDEFTFQDIISYCDVDSKYVMRVVCERFNNIEIKLKNMKILSNILEVIRK